jgi:hypothetical protein
VVAVPAVDRAGALSRRRLLFSALDTYCPRLGCCPTWDSLGRKDMETESIREEARRTGLSKSTVHRRRLVASGRVDPSDRYVADAKEAAVLARRLMLRLARDTRLPFACPREVREAISSIRASIDIIGNFVGQKPIERDEQKASIRQAADDPVKLRSALLNLLAGGYLARDELVAHDLGLWREHLMAFIQHDDRTHLETIQMCYRRWLSEAVSD